MIAAISRGWEKYSNQLKQLSNQAGVPYVWLAIDCVMAKVRYGCVINQYTLGKFYKRKWFERRKMLTYRRWTHLIKNYNNPEFTHYLKNKKDFNTFFSQFVGREWCFSQDLSFEDFKTFVNRHQRIIIKPVDGWEGDGVRLVDLSSHTQSLEKVFEDLTSKPYMIEECIRQHKDMVFGGHSVNTIRAYTAYDKKKKQAFIIKTVVRVGVGDSIVDNSHSGGCAYEVDSNLGVVISESYQADGGVNIIHPQTDICMLGQRIPHWEKVQSVCKQAAEMLPEVSYIGWDVAITEDGPILIEGNHDPDLDMVEFVGSYGYYNNIMSHLK